MLARWSLGRNLRAEGERRCLIHASALSAITLVPCFIRRDAERTSQLSCRRCRRVDGQPCDSFVSKTFFYVFLRHMPSVLAPFDQSLLAGECLAPAFAADAGSAGVGRYGWDRNRSPG